MPKLSIVAMGTSLTARGGWLDAVQGRLAERLDREVSTAAWARSGANSLWGLSVAPRAAAGTPDVALIEFSINDASLVRGMPIEASTRNLKGIVEAFRSARADARIFLMAMNL
ncbi:MAG: SGNH/GDSL hydrolase family protein, partial [Hyphomicrobiales bacterium]|nr:SGNH/GDSL hydrolase family protein [Hyphomicrobiales bacterium]